MNRLEARFTIRSFRLFELQQAMAQIKSRGAGGGLEMGREAVEPTEAGDDQAGFSQPGHVF